ncbi:hypothetical protein CHLRE_16g676600v5 [Chlamydomonas reinhardtii]|uniref:Methylenetetrahydrofolate reductase (NAD(P)H) n=1 Tax=Chlamydomonas reinhardtii TaxID=3055 RepID=A0A2K3CVC3_CHLRE|nr:uncharacterized protein CHLRE_16g676600v5 [Chlamydomonas reinhardtii]PNW72231.1 hypothetical protein CHLRE_16g676600v5 [Chlamydomonas reinhardtii]
MLSQAAAPLGSRLLLHSAAAAAASSAAASAPCAGLASRRFGATRSWGLTAGPAVTAAPSSLPLHLRNLHSSPDSHHGSGAVTPDPSSGGAAAARAGPAADADPAATGTAPTPSPGRGDPGFSPGWTLTLERGIGKSYGKEAELQATAAFRAEVFPDLPIATTWQNWVKAIRSSLTTPPAEDPSPPFTHYATRPGAQKVITVAANLRSPLEIEQRVAEAAGDGAEAAGGQRANVLLCVSGSHPVRTLPGVASLLRSSLDTLRIADRLRQRGYIPPCTQLWVVANPNTERGAGLLERKTELGANAVLTQPPLDWEAYLAWLEDARRRGLLNEQLPPGNSRSTSLSSSGSTSSSGSSSAGPLRLIVGHPMASSAANLSFWVSLAGCGGSAAARQLVADALRAEAGGKEAAAAHAAAYNSKLVEQVLAHGGVAGLHVMPIGKASKALALRMLAEGALPPSV